MHTDEQKPEVRVFDAEKIAELAFEEVLKMAERIEKIQEKAHGISEENI